MAEKKHRPYYERAAGYEALFLKWSEEYRREGWSAEEAERRAQVDLEDHIMAVFSRRPRP